MDPDVTCGHEDIAEDHQHRNGQHQRRQQHQHCRRRHARTPPPLTDQGLLIFKFQNGQRLPSFEIAVRGLHTPSGTIRK